MVVAHVMFIAVLSRFHYINVTDWFPTPEMLAYDRRSNDQAGERSPATAEAEDQDR
jgi:hypothetical protein